MLLTDIKGIGKAYLQKLNAIGVFCAEDLANFLPSGYVDFRKRTPVSEIAAGQYVFARAEVLKTEYNPRGRVVKAALKITEDNAGVDDAGGVNSDGNGGAGDAQNRAGGVSGNEKNGATNGANNGFNDDGNNYENRNADGIDKGIKDKKNGGEKGSENDAENGVSNVNTAALCGAVWFNQPYVKEKLRVGSAYNFFAKAAEKNGAVSLVNPLFEAADRPKSLTGVMPIYRTKGLIPQGIMRKFIKNALEHTRFESISEYSASYGIQTSLNEADFSAHRRSGGKETRSGTMSLTEANFNVRNGGEETRNGKMSLNEAYFKAHCPSGEDEAYRAQRRIAEEDFVKLIFTYSVLKERAAVKKEGCSADGAVLDEFFAAIPFAFTESQRNALNDIIDDMKSGARMNRLLMGDVGSGKTAVAFAAAFFVVKSGRQCALMAPTEILARQHFDNAQKIFGSLGAGVEFLAASLSAAEKRAAVKRLADGSADIAVGTHSLFSENTAYKNLGLIVVDEQQKFGVREKNALKEKGADADLLALSATPIPRAVSLALLGKLDISVIERRAGADTVATRIVSDAKRGDMFRYIRRRVKEGRQAYVVAPRIEDAEGIETDTVKALYRELKEGAFKDIKTALLHGKTPKAERDAAMKGFAEGEIGALVGTTIVEVGLDVANAAVMAVMDADRYGLSTLHQLRGRVGRGNENGTAYCFLHTKKEDNPRLRALLECGDGFGVSERDFELRGGGNFLGERQSGGFETLNDYIVKIDKELIDGARRIADGIAVNEETLGVFRDMNYQKYFNIVKNTVLM
ncbi:MAG: DEAD/DEAH box helicase [Clostridiales bacterium]|jgi:ATP-dependent DNA helicase RecG|nr:DEAD/DEAH box helicase [Clostridiales bacterium]